MRLLAVIEKLKERNLPGEVKLILAIIEKGLEDRDIEYFKGASFTVHAKLLRWNVEDMRKLAIRDLLLSIEFRGDDE